MAFDPQAILAALDRHGVRYVVIGGVASVLHGAPTVTTDIDLVPERSEENLERLVACLREVGAARTTEEGAGASEPRVDDLRYRIEQFDSPLGAIDVVLEAERIGGYDRLEPSSERKRIGGLDVAVASLDDLIMAKQWGSRPKDRIQLRLLLAVQRELREQS